MVNRILLLESAASADPNLQDKLSPLGEVIRAHSIAEAGAKCAHLLPQVILVVCPFAGLDKITVMQQMRDQECGLPIMVLSENLDLENVIKTIRAGAHDVLSQFGNVDDLRRRIRQAIADGARDGAQNCAPMAEIEQGNRISLKVGTRLKDAERLLIDATLKRMGNSVPKTAAMLGVSASTLYRKLEQRQD